MGLMLVSSIFLAFLFFDACQGRQDGAPLGACSSMMPAHSGIPAQRVASDYVVSAENINGRIRVKINSRVGDAFQGFILQARSNKNKQNIVEGMFSEKLGETKATSCFNGDRNTLTHVSPSSKMEIVTDWTPAPNVHDEVIFRATVLKNYQTFYTGVDSNPITVHSSASGNHNHHEPLNSNSIYQNCAVSKGCFGIPDGCINQANCQVLLTYAKSDDGIEFSMHGPLQARNYMAMGLSRDRQMGDDAVTECFLDGTRLHARESWNDGKKNNLIKELTKFNSESKDGISTCRWTETYKKESNGRTFDLENSTYFLLLARGLMDSNTNRLTYHDNRLYSSNAVNFTAFQYIGAEGVTASVKVHGIFMSTAWIGFVSVAILLARHFKNSWESKTISGLKIWFVFHRGFMLIALSLVAIALIVIFVHKNGWNYSTKNPHAILGCITAILGFLQPIMATFRPAIDSPKRPIFNWLHWGVGNGAHILAIVTIYLAKTFESAGLTNAFYWIVSIFLVLHLVFHVLFQLHAWSTGRKKPNDVKMHDMNTGGNIHAQSSFHEKSFSGEVFRNLLLGIYVIFVVVILLAMFAVIGTA